LEPARQAVFISRLIAGTLVMSVWAFVVIYNTIKSGSTSLWVHIGAGIVLGSIFPGGFETVKETIEQRWAGGSSKSQDSQ